MNSNMINRELSWLSFNERVLMEAVDMRNPLMERLRFMSIFSSNMDEFFMVRVSGLREQVNAGYEKPDLSGMSPLEQLQEISERAVRLTALQQRIFAHTKEELARENIHFPSVSDRNFKENLEAIFLGEIMPVVSPVTIGQSHPFPFIYSRRLCLLVEMKKKKNLYTCLIIIPDTLRRVYRIRKGRTLNIFTAEDIIHRHLPLLLKGYEILNTSFFRLTRDADLEVTEEESADLLRAIEHSLSQRKRGIVNRVEVSCDIAESTLAYLEKMIGFERNIVDYVKGSIDLTFLASLTDIKDSLTYPPLKHRPIKAAQIGGDIFEHIKEKPVYFFRPFNSFSFVPDLLEKAANDENVLAIKMTLYRTNSNSRIIAALLEAAGRGKQVSVVVELKARFDEERNIGWAKNLEEAGCIVTYGLMGLKIHAKCMLIVRREKRGIVRYTHIATGNYNEITANIYTDIDMITADEDTGKDATQLFNYLMGYTEEEHWNIMKVAPFNLRSEVISMIDQEIEFSRAETGGHIIIKMNSLIDEEIISKLYEASQAGVKVDLIVRGICGLIPGIKDVSENITVRSIVGRFLEHSRVLYFKHGGKKRYYITSADMMPRNLNGRVELMVEITDRDFKKSLRHYLEMQLKDNCKAWEMEGDIYIKQNPPEEKKDLSSQEYFLNNDL